MEDLLTILQQKAPDFSKGQRALAAYIRENVDKAAFMTAGRLGKAAGVSESTVVRFAMELGFDGYPALQKAMQEAMLNNLTSVQRIGVANDRYGDQDLVSVVLQSDMEKLRLTSQMLDRGAFDLAVKSILKARQIYVLGVRSAATPAGFLGYYLNYMFENVHTITSSGGSEMFERLVNISREDVVIAFSFPRYSSSTLKGVQFCHRVGATVIGVTNSEFSPLAKSCDHLLIAKSDMVSLVDSLVAPLSLVNALIVALASAKEQTVAKTFETLGQIWEEYHVYEKQVTGE